MPDPIVILKAVVLAAVTTSIVILIASRLQSRLGTRLGGAVGTGAGALAGAWMLGLISRIPPSDALERFLLFLFPIAVVTESITRDRIRSILRLVVSASVTPLIVYKSSYVTDLFGPGSREWSPAVTAAIYVGLAIVLFATWTAVSRLAERSGRSVAFAVAGTAGGTAVTVMLSGYASGGQLGMAVAAAVGVLALLGGRHSSPGIGVATVGLFSLLVVGRLFAGLTTLNAVLLFAAPLFAWFPDLLARRSNSMRLATSLQTGLRIALPLAVVAVALVLAQQKFAADSAGHPGEASSSDYQ